MRIFAASDLHTDFAPNLDVVDGISSRDHTSDTLIVAGDLAHQPDLLEDTLAKLRDRFDDVFFVPGNHDLWVGEADGGEDSVARFCRLLDLCETMGVHTRPGTVSGGWEIVPLFSWYENDFGGEPEGAPPPPSGWADFRRCRWPPGMGQAWQYFSDLNTDPLSALISTPPGQRVITFSHFVPRRDLLPATNHLRVAGLLQVAGCRLIEAQLRKAQSLIHVFGHSHIRCDREIDSVRYVQNCLGYPREWKHKGFSLKQIA